MFDQFTPKSIVIWVILWAISKYLVPKILENPEAIKKAIKIVDRPADAVDPLADEDMIEQPIKYRPFRPLNLVTQGISTIPFRKWLNLDATYVDSAKEYARTATCGISANNVVKTSAAVQELFDTVFDLMPRKYPNFFCSTGETLTNLANDEEFVRQTKHIKGPVDAAKLLRTLSMNLDDDLRVYQEVSKKHVLAAFTARKGTPVPQLDAGFPAGHEHLQASLAKSIRSAEKGKYLQRLVWWVEGGEAAAAGAGDGAAGDGQASGSKASGSQAKTDAPGAPDAKLVVEREVYTRLKKSGLLVVSTRTYTYPLADIKEEGLGKQLAAAVKGWPEAVAELYGRDAWATAVIPYLEAV